MIDGSCNRGFDGVRDAFTQVADVATLHARANTPTDPELLALEQPSTTRSVALVNTTAWRRAEFPASNGHGNARSITLTMELRRLFSH